VRFFFVFEDGFAQVPMAVARELKERMPDLTFHGLAQFPRTRFEVHLADAGVALEKLDYFPSSRPRGWPSRGTTPD